MGDHELKRFAGLLLSMEIRSTKWYWHMRVRLRVNTTHTPQNDKEKGPSDPVSKQGRKTRGPQH